MNEVRRLKGETRFGTYVVSVFVKDGRIDKAEICGRGASKTVVKTCEWLTSIKTTLVNESIKAIKLDMMRVNEYRGESCTTTSGPIST